MEQVAKRALDEPIQIPSTLTIPTPAGPAIVSLTTTRTTPTTTTTSCAIMANEKLLRALKAMEHQNARLAHELWKVFPQALKPLLDVHRGAAQQLLGPSFGVAKAQPLPPAAQASPASTSADSSGSAYATTHSSVGEGNEPVEVDAGADDPEWMKALRADALRQGQPRVPPLSVSLSRGVVSNTPSSPSPQIPVTSRGKYMEALLEAHKRENRAAKARAKAKAAKQNVAKPSSSSASTTSTSSEGEQSPVKAKVIKQGNVPTLKAFPKATPKATPARSLGRTI